MDGIALIVARVAIVTSIRSTISSSVRGEVHQQASLIQGLLAELSNLAHEHYLWSMTSIEGSDEQVAIIKAQKANAHEALCSMKCDLLESTLVLLVRRCARRFFFDADVEVFEVNYTRLIGNLRNELSGSCYAEDGHITFLYRIDARLVGLYAGLNEYVGERFRPVFEVRN